MWRDVGLKLSCTVGSPATYFKDGNGTGSISQGDQKENKQLL